MARGARKETGPPFHLWPCRPPDETWHMRKADSYPRGVRTGACNFGDFEFCWRRVSLSEHEELYLSPLDFRTSIGQRASVEPVGQRGGDKFTAHTTYGAALQCSAQHLGLCVLMFTRLRCLHSLRGCMCSVLHRTGPRATRTHKSQ